MIAVINGSDRTNVMSAAHVSVLRIEAVSYLSGYAFATAAATLVGTELGRRDPARAARAARFAYLGGGGVMPPAACSSSRSAGTRPGGSPRPTRPSST